MKTYQERWLRKLADKEDVRKVCRQICEDDTGGTDPIAMRLAALHLEALERVEPKKAGEPICGEIE